MGESHAPDGYASVTPYLMVDEPERLLRFCAEAFDAELLERLESEGAVVHAEVRIGDSVVMMGRTPPGSSAFRSCLYVYVEDCDASHARALRAGATLHGEPRDQFYGDRTSSVTGPCGNHWSLATRKENLDSEELQRRIEERT